MKKIDSGIATILATLLIGALSSRKGSKAIPEEAEKLKSKEETFEIRIPIQMEFYMHYQDEWLDDLKEEIEEDFNNYPWLEMIYARLLKRGDRSPIRQGGLAWAKNNLIKNIRLEVEDLEKAVDRKVKEIEGYDLDKKLTDYNCRYGDQHADEMLYEEFERMQEEDGIQVLDRDGYFAGNFSPEIEQDLHGLLDEHINDLAERMPGEFLVAKCVSSGINSGTEINGELVFTLNKKVKFNPEIDNMVPYRYDEKNFEGIGGFKVGQSIMFIIQNIYEELIVQNVRHTWQSWNGRKPLEWTRFSGRIGMLPPYSKIVGENIRVEDHSSLINRARSTAVRET